VHADCRVGLLVKMYEIGVWVYNFLYLGLKALGFALAIMSPDNLFKGS
jgi:hypothetical protein